MKLPKYFGKPKRPKALIIRQVVGNSMAPTLLTGQLIVASRFFLVLRKGDIIIVQHDGIEKIKRIKDIRPNEVYLLGDNSSSSRDSRHFGWLPLESVVGKVVWPIRKTIVVRDAKADD